MALAALAAAVAAGAYLLRANRLVLGVSVDPGNGFYGWLESTLPEGRLLSPEDRGILDAPRAWKRPDLVFGELSREELLRAFAAAPRRGGDPVLLGFDPYVLVYKRGTAANAPAAADLLSRGRRIILAGADDGDLTAFLVFILGFAGGRRAVEGLYDLPGAGLDDPGTAALAALLQDLVRRGILEPAWYDRDLIALRADLEEGRLSDAAFCSYGTRRALSPIQAFDYRTVPLPSAGGGAAYPIRSLGVRTVAGSPAGRKAEVALTTLASPASLRGFAEQTSYLSFSPSGPFLNRDHRELLAALLGAEPFPIGPALRSHPDWDLWLATFRTYLRSR